MLAGPDPLRAIRIITELDLSQLIFSHHPLNTQSNSVGGDECLAHGIHYLLHAKIWSLGIPRLVYLSSILYPFANDILPDRKGKKDSAARQLVLSSLKLCMNDADACHAIIERVEECDRIVGLFDAGLLEVSELGSFLRDPSMITLGENWKMALAFSCAIKIGGLLSPRASDPLQNRVNVANHEADLEIEGQDPRVNAIVSVYERFFRLVRECGFDGLWAWKPVLSGRDIMLEFEVKKGPSIRVALDEVMRWQILHAIEYADQLEMKAACLAYFKSLDIPFPEIETLVP
jgi:hypothetical protein